MTFILNIVSFVATNTSHEDKLSPHFKVFVLTLECVLLFKQSVYINTAVLQCSLIVMHRNPDILINNTMSM